MICIPLNIVATNCITDNLPPPVLTHSKINQSIELFPLTNNLTVLICNSFDLIIPHTLGVKYCIASVNFDHHHMTPIRNSTATCYIDCIIVPPTYITATAPIYINSRTNIDNTNTIHIHITTSTPIDITSTTPRDSNTITPVNSTAYQ